MASERTQRELAGVITDDIQGEFIPFSFPLQRRGQIMRQAPCVWVQDLEEKIVNTIQLNDRYSAIAPIYIGLQN